MSELRRDIAEAAVRMAVTFGTRSAMRDLAEELEVGERVIDLAACSYAGAAGLAALTTQRVLAIRDDYSKHQVQFATLGDIQTIDYDPNVHDGFAVFTAKARLVVRKMRRVDEDRLVDAAAAQAGAAQQAAQNASAQSAATQSAANQSAANQSAANQSAANQSAANQNAATQSATVRRPEPAAPAAGSVAQAMVTPVLAKPAPPPSAEPAPSPAAPRQAIDQEILLGVLADLHTQGVLTAEEFAAKVRQVVAPD